MNLKKLALDWLRVLAARPAPRSVALPRSVRRRRAAAITIAVGAVVFAVLQLTLGAAAELSLRVRDPGYSDKEVRLGRREALNPGAPLVLMLGTSRTGYGFHAGRVEDTLTRDLGRPVTVYNFGIPASGPVTHQIYLRRLLAAGHRPSLLLLEVLPPSLALLPPNDEPLESRFMFGDRLRRSEVETAVGYGFPAAARGQWRQSVLLPWYGLRFPLLARVFPSAIPWHLRFDWSRTTDPHGWSRQMVETVTPQAYQAGLEQAGREYRQILADMWPTGGAARALTDLLAFCREQRIPVRLVLMPEGAGFRAMYPRHTHDRLYDFLRQACASHWCELTDARAWVPDAGFTDGHHMLRSGAETFSDRVTREAIAPAVRGGR